MVGIGHRQLQRAVMHGELHRLAAAIRRNGRDAVDGRGEAGAIDAQFLVIVLGRHPLIVGERALDQLGQQHHAIEGEADLGVRNLDADIALDAFEKLLHFGNGLLGNDDTGHALGPGRRVDIGTGQAMAIGSDGAQRARLAHIERVHINAVEVIARLFVRDGELGALDQLAQRCRRQRETVREAARFQVGEAVGREAREVETRAAGTDLHLLGAIGFEPYFAAVGELAHDFVERMRGHSGRACRLHHRRHRLGHFDVEIGGAQVDLAVRGLEQHVGEDRVGVAPLNDAMHMPQRLQQRVALQCDLHPTHFPNTGPPASNPRKSGPRPWQFGPKNASAAGLACPQSPAIARQFKLSFSSAASVWARRCASSRRRSCS